MIVRRKGERRKGEERKSGKYVEHYDRKKPVKV